MRRRWTLLIVVLALSAGLGACGSGGEETSGPLTLGELSAQAGRSCRQTAKQVAGFVSSYDFGAPRDASGADLYLEQQRRALLDRDVTVMERWVDAMAALKPDQQAAARWRAYLEAQRAYLERIRDLAAFQRRVAAERDFGARELRKSFGQSYVDNRDAAEATASEAGARVGKGARRWCPSKLPSQSVFTFPTIEQAYLSRLRGDYAGTVRQIGPGRQRSSYPVKVSLTRLVRGKVGGFVSYPSFPCSGDWRFLGLRGRRFFYREEIDTGDRTCFVKGAVSVRVVGDRLDFDWRSDDGAVEVVGGIRRTSESP
ncbi:MAG: hypothetical protein U0R52_07805 [Solirubrobacterales bacterium]